MLIKFAEIDATQPLQPIHVDARYSRLFILVRWGYLPLGMLRLQCGAGLRTFSVERLQDEILQTVGWQLWEQAVGGNLKELNAGADRSLPAISVIVCTRDRPLSLARCLQGLAQLDYPAYEVVVVDNCSRDETVAGIAAWSGFRYVREDTPGLDWARNRGIREARHDIVAFIDDDALAMPGWLRGVARGFEDLGVMAVTGMVMPAEIETAAQNDFEIYGGMNKGFVSRTIRLDSLSERALFWSSNWGVGTNMAFRRALFEDIGDFDVALDVGTPAAGGGDIEFFYRAVARGHALRYEPAAMAYHVHRRDSAGLKQQIYNNGRSFGAYLLTVTRNEPRKFPRVVWFAVRWWLWDWLLRRLIGSLIKRDRRMFRFALTELWGSCSAPLAYWKSQRLSRHLQAKRL
jgi:glycosyltransferase involved in cell wall biosynthesis